MPTGLCITKGCGEDPYRNAPYCKLHADEILHAIFSRMILEGKVEYDGVDADGNIRYRSLIYEGPEESPHGKSD